MEGALEAGGAGDFGQGEAGAAHEDMGAFEAKAPYVCDAGAGEVAAVNHGPCVVDNNLFLSRRSLLDWSEGTLFAHNLFAGEIAAAPVPARISPHHPTHSTHSTEVLALAPIAGGNNRVFNNVLLAPAGLAVYEGAELQLSMLRDNVVWSVEADADGNPGLRVDIEGERVWLPNWSEIPGSEGGRALQASAAPSRWRRSLSSSRMARARSSLSGKRAMRTMARTRPAAGTAA